MGAILPSCPLCHLLLKGFRMSNDWIPAGSRPYDLVGAVDDWHVTGPNDGGSFAVFSTTPYKPPKSRSPKKCVGNDGKCEGWKSAGSNLCAGHMKSQVKAAKGALVLSLMGLVA